MRPISFGKLTVQNSGTPLNFGRTTLAASIGDSDETLQVTSATPFCQDMLPFKLDIDPTGTTERVIVKKMSGSTFTIQRGAEGTAAAAHTSGCALVASFPFAQWDFSTISGGSGKVYFGEDGLNISTGAGVINELVPQSTAPNDRTVLLPSSDMGNPYNLSDYGMDVATSNQGAWVTLWVR